MLFLFFEKAYTNLKLIALNILFVTYSMPIDNYKQEHVLGWKNFFYNKKSFLI